jgi:Transposase DDE domain
MTPLTPNLLRRQDEYTLYLLSEQRRSSATKAGAAYENSTRYSFQWFLENSETSPELLFRETSQHMQLVGGVLSIDDSVEDKHFSVIGKAHFVDRFWSGRHKKVVVGIDLLTLFYTDVHWVKMPVNWRIVDKASWKTKNDYFLEMVSETLNWWIQPRVATGDSWFASQDNMKFFIKRKIGFLFALKSNRQASDETRQYKALSEYMIPEEGRVLHLKDVGFVRIFQKNDLLYAYHDASTTDTIDKGTLEKVTQKDFEEIHACHWHIEEYHRALKQVCNTDKHYFRNKNTIINHIYCSLRAFCILEISRLRWRLKNWYAFATEAMAAHVKHLTSTTRIENMCLVMS